MKGADENTYTFLSFSGQLAFSSPFPNKRVDNLHVVKCGLAYYFWICLDL